MLEDIYATFCVGILSHVRNFDANTYISTANINTVINHIDYQ